MDQRLLVPSLSSVVFKMASENEKKTNDTNEIDNKETEEIVVPNSKSCKGIIKDPNFAVVCSFIKIFGPLLHFKELSIDTLQQFFDTPTRGIILNIFTRSNPRLEVRPMHAYTPQLPFFIW